MIKGRTTQDILYSIGGVAILFSILLIWQLVSVTNILPSTVFPAASTVLATLLVQLESGILTVELEATLIRLLEGYFLAAIIGISVGLVMGSSKTAENAGDPLIQFLRPMPSAVLIPLAILYFGLGDFMIVSIVFYACTWPIIINTMDGVRNIEPIVLDTAKEYGIKNFARIWKVILPASAPFIFSGLRVSLAVAWVVAITAEILSTAATTGLGAAIYLDLNTGALAQIYATVIMIAVSAYALNRLFLFVESRMIPWHLKSKQR